MAYKPMTELYIIDYCDLFAHPAIVVTKSLAARKLIKAGCELTHPMSPKDQRANLQEIYQQMRSMAENMMATSKSSK